MHLGQPYRVQCTWPQIVCDSATQPHRVRGLCVILPRSLLSNARPCSRAAVQPMHDMRPCLIVLMALHDTVAFDMRPCITQCHVCVLHYSVYYITQAVHYSVSRLCNKILNPKQREVGGWGAVTSVQ